MKAFLREVFFICCMVIAVVSEIAAATIAVAIAINKLTDSQAWMAAVFFAAKAVMTDPLAEPDPNDDSEPPLDAGFDNYRSLANSNIRIIVAKDVVPPFRFKAAGWELLPSSNEPGSAIRTRIAERGFFLFRVNEDGAGGSELTNFPLPSEGGSVE
jgi:hypothetical protein